MEPGLIPKETMMASSRIEEETDSSSKAPKRKASFLVADLISQDSNAEKGERRESDSEDVLVKPFSGFLDKGL